MVWKASIFCTALLVVTYSIANGAVVGLNQARKSFSVSVRGFFPAGTRVTGITFYSNDKTNFPEIALVSDASTEGRLPQLGKTVRSQSNVLGQSGYMAVGFPEYLVRHDQYLWAVVRFPDDVPLRARGINGGPGIGWREERVLRNETSWFSVEGSFNEFTPAFDITIQTTVAVAGKSAGSLDLPASPTGTPGVFTVQARFQNSGKGTVFQLVLPKIGRVSIDLYTISGRHVIRLARNLFDAGRHEVVWSGLDAHGRRVPSGIYLYKAHSNQEERSGKVVILR